MSFDKFFAVVFCLLVLNAGGQTSAADLEHRLRKLGVTGSVLYVAAHPDDENTRLLAHLSGKLGLRTGYISLTRGDGGQNLIGTEQGPALGVLRTQELLEARRIDGAEQFFSRAFDFGYSKNPEETLRFWNRDTVLSDLVWVIRSFRPDVIICRFPTTGEGGHGHHTASAILAEEAFDVAADPTRFPWQVQRAGVWQAKRLFWNTYNFGTVNTTSEEQIKVEAGDYEPLLGRSFGEIASMARTMHKSQGFGTALHRGESTEYFKLIKGAPAKELFEGIETGWAHLPGGSAIEKQVKRIRSRFDSEKPWLVTQDLLLLRKQIQKMPAGGLALQDLKARKIREIEELILDAEGFWLELRSSQAQVVPGGKLMLQLKGISRGGSSVSISTMQYPDGRDTVLNLQLLRNKGIELNVPAKVSEETPLSLPYWLMEGVKVGTFGISLPGLNTRAEGDSPLQFQFRVKVLGEEIVVNREPQYYKVDPVQGEQYTAVQVVPAVELHTGKSVYVSENRSNVTVKVTLKSNAGKLQGEAGLDVPPGWVLKGPPVKLVLEADAGEEISFELVPGEGAGEGELRAWFRVSTPPDLTEGIYRNGLIRITYPHIKEQLMLKPATAKLIVPELKTDITEVGYIPGAGDEIPACLEEAGIKVRVISDEEIASGDLSRYRSIVTGVRAYNTNEKLQLYHSRLMSYVEKGGNLVVQYNTNSRIGPAPPVIGPYPFTISRNRVSDETVPVQFLLPEHPALNYPNKITAADFDGWIQERGVYYSTSEAGQYARLLRMNDPGEEPQDGSLIIAAHGKGNFVYSGLSFFRQLPAGVPGAYRLLVNLINLPNNE